MKKIIMAITVLVFTLIAYSPYNEVEVTKIETTNEIVVIQEEIRVVYGVIVEINSDSIIVYNRLTTQIEEYSNLDFYYEESLLMPEVGAFVKKKTNEELWTVYKTYSLVEYY